MLRHIVMWKFHPEVSPEQKAEMKSRLEGLLGVVPGLKAVRVEEDALGKPGAMDMLLIADFEDSRALEAYAEHPEHLRAVEFIRPLVSSRAVVDFQT